MSDGNQEQLIIVSGMSGAGKTQALRAFEDMGFFCVDNLPPSLVPGFAELLREGGGPNRVALVMDIRGGRFFEGLFCALDHLDRNGFRYEILFLEAADETLVRRYTETRRRHPLSPEGRILEGVLEERRRMEELRGRADKVIDTSEMTNRQLRDQVEMLFGQGTAGKLVITVMSFGFKYGVPLDADLVMDVRFLPNPHYVESLKPLTGQDPLVRDYVMGSPATTLFLDKWLGLLQFLIPYYVQEGKAHLVIAIGCTGGQHRSVTIANQVADVLGQNNSYRVNVQHRDAERNRRGGGQL